MQLNQITLPATKIKDSVAFYLQMGFTQIVASEHYARFECPDGDTTFSLHQVTLKSAVNGIVIYFECNDLDLVVQNLKMKGLTFNQDIKDEPWLWREARLYDPTGNEICLYHAGDKRKYPPWRVNIKNPK